MSRSPTPTSMRIDPAVKEALARAAAADDRSVSAMATRILRAWLVQHGFMSGGEGDKPSA